MKQGGFPNSYGKVKENRVKIRQFCRIKTAAFVAVAMVLSFVTACDGKMPLRSSSSDLVARVVRVADGDTLTVLDASQAQHKIRHQGIDAPEKGQAYGDAAERYLAGLVACGDA